MRCFRVWPPKDRLGRIQPHGHGERLHAGPEHRDAGTVAARRAPLPHIPRGAVSPAQLQPGHLPTHPLHLLPATPAAGHPAPALRVLVGPTDPVRPTELHPHQTGAH